MLNVEVKDLFLSIIWLHTFASLKNLTSPCSRRLGPDASSPCSCRLLRKPNASKFPSSPFLISPFLSGALQSVTWANLEERPKEKYLIAVWECQWAVSLIPCSIATRRTRSRPKIHSHGAYYSHRLVHRFGAGCEITSRHCPLKNPPLDMAPSSRLPSS